MLTRVGARSGCCTPSGDKRRSPSAATDTRVDLDVWWRDWTIYWADHLQSNGGAGIPRRAGRPVHSWLEGSQVAHHVAKGEVGRDEDRVGRNWNVVMVV